MPDSAGKLDEAETQRAVAWLNRHWTNQACPFHGPTRWEVGYVIMTLPYSGQGIMMGGPTYPLIVVTCGTCGYTVLVNAIKAGIVQQVAPQPTVAAAPAPAPPPEPTPPQSVEPPQAAPTS